MIRDTRVVHALLGNDTAPWTVAIARAILGAAILGGVAAMSAWSTTDDIPDIIRAGLTAALGFLALRGAAEGWIDTRKNGR